MAGHVIQSTAENFSQHIDTTTPVVLDFWAEWCGPCKRLLPVIEEVAREREGALKFVKVNVDNNQEVPTEYQVMSIPTLVFLKEGKEVERIVGALSKESLLSKLQSTFGI